MIELIKEFSMAILWLFLGYLIGERAARKMINNVTLVGRLTKDPELKYTPSNVAVATFTLLVGGKKHGWSNLSGNSSLC
ncbi:prophage LambdaSa2%2C single-strand binding protein [Streptococcus pneumoniae]|nr:prophage LambdaSa2%2C single-strand binding protein [Streptococcus pneumoniae]